MSLSRGYDNLLCMEDMTASGGETVTYGHDPQGRLQSVGTPGLATVYGYTDLKHPQRWNTLTRTSPTNRAFLPAAPSMPFPAWNP